MLKAITHSPYLNFLSGLVLLITSGYETWISFGEGIIGAHHGILMFGVVHIAKSIPEIMHGLDELEDGEEFMSDTK